MYQFELTLASFDMVSQTTINEKRGLTLGDLPLHLQEHIVSLLTEPLRTAPCQDYGTVVRQATTLQQVCKRWVLPSLKDACCPPS